MMKASFAQSDVSPKQPVKQAGFIQQKEKRSEVRDPLYVQMLGIDDGKKIIIGKQKSRFYCYLCAKIHWTVTKYLNQNDIFSYKPSGACRRISFLQ